jgi:prophage maintenance system killer protein
MKEIVIYQSEDNNAKVEVSFEGETCWLTLNQIAALFERDKSVISRHLSNVFKEGELDKEAAVAKNATVQNEGDRKVTREIEYYNLDAILSVGYRINSKRGTQFRQWATQRLKEYLVQGYAINQKRLAEKEMEVRHLKSGIRILYRTLEYHVSNLNQAKRLAAMLDDFSRGLSLLDDYDHQQLDPKGKSRQDAVFISYAEFIEVIKAMRTDFSDGFFGREKDDSFKSSAIQIYQSFGGQDLYPSLEEKAAMLLYLIVKNHSFVDGNKRIAAACFLYFLDKNNLLYGSDGIALLSNDALASMTLFIAESKPEEMETVKQVVISILNRKIHYE